MITRRSQRNFVLLFLACLGMVFWPINPTDAGRVDRKPSVGKDHGPELVDSHPAITTTNPAKFSEAATSASLVIPPALAQASQYAFERHQITWSYVKDLGSIGCKTYPFIDTRTNATDVYAFNYVPDVPGSAGCANVSIPDGQISINFPETFTPGAAFPASINVAGSLNVFVDSQNFQIRNLGLLVDTVINRYPNLESPPLRGQDLRQAPCALARFRKLPPLTGGTSSVPGLNPFSSPASCNITAPSIGQSFDGDAILIISTIHFVLGGDPLGPANFFSYNAAPFLTFTITSRYRPATCPVQSRPGILQSEAAQITSLDQKIAARNTAIKLTIRGQDFAADAVPVFLRSDGTVDPKLTLSNLNVTCTEIQAELFVDHDAPIGPRSLRVRSGGQDSTPLANAINVIGMDLKMSQGAKVSEIADRIANHPTVIRTAVETASTTPGLVNGLTGLLYVFRGNAQISGSPFRPVPAQPVSELKDKLLPMTSFNAIDRFFMRDTLNFYFGVGNPPGSPALPEGVYTFVLAVSPTDPSTFPAALANNVSKQQLLTRRDQVLLERVPEDTFVTTNPLRLLLVVDPRLSATDADRLYNIHQRSLEFMRAVYPIDGAKLLVKRISVTTNVLDIAGGPFAVRRLPGKLQEILEDHNRRAEANHQFDRIVLLMKKDTLVQFAGAAGYSLLHGVAQITGAESPGTTAHEIGHGLGLGDTYAFFGQSTYESVRGIPNPRRADALPAGNRVEDGAERLLQLWKIKAIDGRSDATGEAILGASASVNDTCEPIVDGPCRRVSFMSSANGNTVWADLVEWNHLSRKLRLTGGQSPNGVEAAEASSDMLTVRGLIDIAGTLADVSVTRGSVFPDPIDPEPGDFAFELTNGFGQILSSTSFGVDFIQPDVGLVTASSFSVSSPFIAGTTQVRIRKDGVVLFTRTISATPPAVQVLSPSGGETLGGPFTINWTASDPDGGSLTYSVFYLRSGIEPVPIATDLTGTSFQWSDPTLNGGGPGGKIVVVASDGVNEGSGTSQPFTVNKRSPVVTILTPDDGLAFPAGTQLALYGTGTDPEDGILPSSAITFSSNLDGNLGSGNTVVRILSQGTHTILMRGVDQDGNAATDSITVIVGGASNVPVIDNITPMAGAVDAVVTLTGRNFDPNGTEVKFGSLTAIINSISTVQLVVRVPASQVGATSVTVSARGFTSNAVSFTVLNGRPLLVSLSPDSGPPGTPVFIRGVEFAATAADNTVSFGSVQAQTLGADSNGLLVAVPLGLPLGTVNVSVTTPQGISNTLPFNVTGGDPNGLVFISSVSPSAANSGETVTISGIGFSSVTSRNVVSVGGIAVAPLNVTGTSIQALVPVGAVSGQTYVLVSVNGYPSNPLPFTVGSAPTPTPTPIPTPTPTPGPANNNFGAVQIIGGSSGTVTGSNVAASKETGEPNHAGNAGGRSVWYRWQAPASGNVIFSTAGSSFDTLLAVYTGSSIPSLTEVVSNDDVNEAELGSIVSFNAISGTIYQIAVDGFNGASGNLSLNWSAGTVGDTVALNSGVAQPGSIAAPDQGFGLLGATQYTIAVPSGATQLKVDLAGNQDVDLYVRFNQRISVAGGLVVADFTSETFTGNESINITGASSPQLLAGTYFIAVANYGPGAANFNVTATVTGGQTAAASFQFGANFTVAETSNTALITVLRAGNTGAAVAVDYATALATAYVPCTVINGTAQQHCDFSIASGRLTFGVGETSKSFEVLISDDNYMEGNETVSLALSLPSSGAALGAQNTATLTIVDNDVTAAMTNPLDGADAKFFVRQHYYDFLSRLPDEGGLGFWAFEISGCGADALCVDRRRVGVSAAFFIELEFQQTGYVVYRLYRAAYGSLAGAPSRANLLFADFMPDRSQLVAGPQLQQSTIDFANRFVERAAFKQAYPDSMTATGFVNKLFDTAGLSGQAERQAAIQSLSNGSKTRAQVLLELIEMTEFRTREFNPAFVLMQYFGYLRRDPDQGGYDFWLSVLNNVQPNNFRGMVCAFITSREYQERFSPVITRSDQLCANIN